MSLYLVVQVIDASVAVWDYKSKLFLILNQYYNPDKKKT